MKVIEYKVKKGKRFTKKMSIELCNLFAPYTPKDEWDYGKDEWIYRPITYLFDDGKNWVWTNTPKLHQQDKLMGVFYFKNKIIKF